LINLPCPLTRAGCVLEAASQKLDAATLRALAEQKAAELG
jgi:hypothetical protein